MNGLSEIQDINAWASSDECKAFEEKRQAQSKRIAAKNTADKFLGRTVRLQGREVNVS